MKPILFLLVVLPNLNSFAQISTPNLIHDESYLDPSFVAFRLRLGEALLQRDTNLLKPLLSASILESKDGCFKCTPSFFLSYTFGESASSSWEELEKITRFGFRRIEADQSFLGSLYPKEVPLFQAPSYQGKFSQDSLLLILGENVHIRQSPSLSAPILSQASYELFSCDCWIMTATSQTLQKIEERLWHELYLADGRKGYVAYDYTSESIQRELTVAKINGRWQIVSFFRVPGC